MSAWCGRPMLAGARRCQFHGASSAGQAIALPLVHRARRATPAPARRCAARRGRRRTESAEPPSLRARRGSSTRRLTASTTRAVSVPTSRALPDVDAFGALGRVAQHEQGHAERGGFFLHPARIAEDEVGAAHRVDHRAVAERGDEANPRLVAEQGPHRRARPADWGGARRRSSPCRARASATSAIASEVSPAPQFSRRWQVTSNLSGRRAARAAARARHRRELGQQRVDAAIAGDVERARAAFAVEVGGGACGRGEQQVGDGGRSRQRNCSSGQGERGSKLRRPASTWASGRPQLLGGARAAERARRVALDDHQFGRRAAPVALERARRPRRHGRAGRARPAQPSGVARHAAKAMVGKIEPGMLAGEVEMDGDAPRAIELERDRRELDGFGPGSDDETDTNRLQLSPWLRRRHCAASPSGGKLDKRGNSLGSLNLEIVGVGLELERDRGRRGRCGCRSPCGSHKRPLRPWCRSDRRTWVLVSPDPAQPVSGSGRSGCSRSNSSVQLPSLALPDWVVRRCSSMMRAVVMARRWRKRRGEIKSLPAWCAASAGRRRDRRATGGADSGRAFPWRRRAS